MNMWREEREHSKSRAFFGKVKEDLATDPSSAQVARRILHTAAAVVVAYDATVRHCLRGPFVSGRSLGGGKASKHTEKH